jgi:lipopolysaccharide export system protein LptC
LITFKVWIISIDQKNQSSLGKLLENTISLKDNVNACEFNPDGTKLLVSTAKEVRLYPAISGNEPLNDFLRWRGEVRVCRISPNGK